MTKLFERIQLLCDQRNLTIYAIEKAAHLSDRSMRKWEESMPSGDKILRVANFFDVSVDYLLGNTDNPQSHKNNPQDLAVAAEKLAAAARALSAAAGAASDKIQSDIREILDICHVSTAEMLSEKNQASPKPESEPDLTENQGENIRP